MNSLTTKWVHGRTHYLDLLVDGVSLLSILESGDADLVGCLGSAEPSVALEGVNRLLGKARSGSDSNRVPFYVCPMCGDLGCGGITGVVEIDGDVLIWKDFAFQNDTSPIDHPDVGIYEEFLGVGPFSFQLSNCEQVFRSSLVSP